MLKEDKMERGKEKKKKEKNRRNREGSRKVKFNEREKLLKKNSVHGK